MYWNMSNANAVVTIYKLTSQQLFKFTLGQKIEKKIPGINANQIYVIAETTGLLFHLYTVCQFN